MRVILSMGKSKNKNRKPDEMLLGENRLYRKQVKKLQQEIKRLQKEAGYNQNKSPKVKEQEEPTPNCPDCARGFLSEVEFVGRIYVICPVCNYRKKK